MSRQSKEIFLFCVNGTPSNISFALFLQNTSGSLVFGASVAPSLTAETGRWANAAL